MIKFGTYKDKVQKNYKNKEQRKKTKIMKYWGAKQQQQQQQNKWNYRR